MRWIRILVLALALSLLGLAAPDQSFAGERDDPRIKFVSPKDKKREKKKRKIKKVRKKKRPPKPKKKHKKKKKKPGFKEPKSAVGVRGGVTPMSDMDVQTDAGGADLDPRMAFGMSLVTQHRLLDKPSIYVLGEFTHWWHELKDQKTSSKDSLLTIATGIRINVMGQANKARDRVFVKGLVGYTYYAASADNAIKHGGMGASDRSGIYFGGGIGFEHLFRPLPISVFVDTGVYNHNFSVDPAAGEDESSLLTWEVGAGFLYHF